VNKTNKKFFAKDFQEKLYLDPELKERLRVTAFNQGTKKSAIMRMALRLWFRVLDFEEAEER